LPASAHVFRLARAREFNHERKEPLAGFVGMVNFAKEVYASVASPVWQFAPRLPRFGENRLTVHSHQVCSTFFMVVHLHP
jgi:hypothetical protein